MLKVHVERGKHKGYIYNFLSCPLVTDISIKIYVYQFLLKEQNVQFIYIFVDFKILKIILSLTELIGLSTQPQFQPQLAFQLVYGRTKVRTKTDKLSTFSIISRSRRIYCVNKLEIWQTLSIYLHYDIHKYWSFFPLFFLLHVAFLPMH